jgi:hypothetical protein
MIVGGIIISIALLSYYFYYPRLPPKGSLGYYKYQWKLLN